MSEMQRNIAVRTRRNSKKLSSTVGAECAFVTNKTLPYPHEVSRCMVCEPLQARSSWYNPAFFKRRSAVKWSPAAAWTCLLTSHARKANATQQRKGIGNAVSETSLIRRLQATRSLGSDSADLGSCNARNYTHRNLCPPPPKRK
jgi:hypothetical protein